jgi:hypothetical protein
MDVNPVWIKEWRQVCRSRFVQGLAIAMLLGQWLAMVSCLLAMEKGYAWTTELSPGLLLARMIWLIMVGAISAIALDLYGRTSHEWRPAARDLVFTTSLKPRRMLAGKFLTSLTFNGFVLSLALPFLLISAWFQGVNRLSSIALGEIGQSMVLLGLLGLFIQGAAVAAAIANLPRPVTLLAGGYLFAFIGWRPIFLRPEQLPSLQLFLVGHVLLVWLVASFALLSPAAARRSRRLLWGIPIVIALAGNDWYFYNTFPPALQTLLSQVVILAAAGYLATLALLGWIYWRRRGSPIFASDNLADWINQLKNRPGPMPPAAETPPAAEPPEPLPPIVAAPRSPDEAGAGSGESPPWLPRFDRPKTDFPAPPILPAWGETSEANPVFIKVMRSLIRQNFFVLLPLIVFGFVLATMLLQQVFMHTLVGAWPMYDLFFRTFLLLNLMLFWSMSYEIVHRALEEWGGEAAATDPIRLAPLGGYRILGGLLQIGLLTMPLPWLASVPNLWSSGLLKGWDPWFWPAIGILALAAVAIYLWTLAVSFWSASRSFKGLFSLVLFFAICPRSLWLAPSLGWDFTAYAVLFAGMAAASLTTPWRRHWLPLVLHFLVGATLLAGRGVLDHAEISAAFQVVAFAAAYLHLWLEHRRR